MLTHGGNLDLARALYGEPDGGWIDLSTGINPVSYPFVMPPLARFQSLPDMGLLHEVEASLLAQLGAPKDLAALAGGGSHVLLKLLPSLISDQASVAVFEPTYAEHREVWEAAGACVKGIDDFDQALNSEVTLLVHPNNPTGTLYPYDKVRRFLLAAKKLRLLVIDEAFIDLYPDQSLWPLIEEDDRVVVLRSFGKFFGLAGVRLAWLVGQKNIIDALRPKLGPWPVSGAALDIAIQALNDKAWQYRMRIGLNAKAKRRDNLLDEHSIPILGSTPLFALIESSQAKALHAHLAHYGIWARRFDYAPTWLRLGLPKDEIAWQGLSRALGSFKHL